MRHLGQPGMACAASWPAGRCAAAGSGLTAWRCAAWSLSKAAASSWRHEGSSGRAAALRRPHRRSPASDSRASLSFLSRAAAQKPVSTLLWLAEQAACRVRQCCCSPTLTASHCLSVRFQRLQSSGMRDASRKQVRWLDGEQRESTWQAIPEGVAGLVDRPGRTDAREAGALILLSKCRPAARRWGPPDRRRTCSVWKRSVSMPARYGLSRRASCRLRGGCVLFGKVPKSVRFYVEWK